jgi:hypothetical protein
MNFVSMPSKAKNSIKAIHVYLWNGMWVFDDEAVGLDKEPFVAGADTLISKIAKDKKEINIIFADIPFPTAQIRINKMDKAQMGEDGTNYYCPELKHHLWLCPALLKYFEFAPSTIWAEFK